MAEHNTLTAELVSDRDDEARIRLVGYVDYETVAALADLARQCLDAGAHTLVLDIRKVDFFDSIGLGALVTAYRRVAAAGGVLRLIGATHRVRAMLDVTGLSQLFELVDA